MTIVDLLVALVPSLVTMAFVSGLLRASETMAPPSWRYWLPLVCALTCVLLPFRYANKFLPDEDSLVGSPRSMVFDMLLHGSFAAVAVGLALVALRVQRQKLPPQRGLAGYLMLAISLLFCLMIAGSQIAVLIEERNSPDSVIFEAVDEVPEPFSSKHMGLDVTTDADAG